MPTNTWPPTGTTASDGSANVTVVGGTLGSITASVDTIVSHANDSIKVGDGTDFLAINGDGSINAVSADADLTGAPPAAASVGVASGTAVAANANRKGLILTNTSTAWISLGFDGNAAVLYSGVTLAPNGGTFSLDKYCFSNGAVTAIASAAASNLGVQEFT